MPAGMRASVPRRIGLSATVLVVALLAATLAACGATDTQPAGSGDVEIVDSAGRHVLVPAEVDVVFGTDPVATTVLYTLVPEKLAGWNYSLTPVEKEFIPEQYERLPDLGGWYGKNMVGNVEEILRHDVDLLVMMIASDAAAAEQADRIEQATGLPVVVLDGSLTAFDQTYETLGGLLGEEARAARLGGYCRDAVDEVRTRVSDIPEAERTSIYYAEGLKGLETDPEGSVHTEVISLAGGLNVADVPASQSHSRTPVSLEQVLALGSRPHRRRQQPRGRHRLLQGDTNGAPLGHAAGRGER